MNGEGTVTSSTAEGLVANPAGRPMPRVERLSFERERVDGTCPSCGADDLATYPVNSEGGWFIAVKCQQCLYSLERTPWYRLGPIRLLSDTI